jgi:lysophospholipase L1-like esterase
MSTTSNRWLFVGILFVSACSNNNSGGTGSGMAPALGAAGSTTTPPTSSTPTSSTTAAGSTPASTTTGAAGTAAPRAGSSASSAAGSGGHVATTDGVAGSAGATPASTGAAGAVATAGSGGTSNAGSGAAGGGAAGSTGSSDRVPSPCLKKGSQVVFIGDSYINYDVAHTLLSTLIEQRAVKDGALMQGDHYRNYAVPGTALAADNVLGMIPPQWDMAVQDDPDIKFVIMDGGGNDVLIDNMQCLAAGSDKDPQCQMVVANTLKVGTELINKIKAAGVSDGIYFFYPHVPVGGDDINDYALSMLKDSEAALQTPTFHTYVLDLIPIFMGHSDWFADDGIHANDTGENVIADNIWKIMKDNCVAQPASAGCGCTP